MRRAGARGISARGAPWCMRKEGLHDWFAHKNGGGGGWVDCKASRKGKLVPCGRASATAKGGRSYPACRPTLGACNRRKALKRGPARISWQPKSK